MVKASGATPWEIVVLKISSTLKGSDKRHRFFHSLPKNARRAGPQPRSTLRSK